MSVYSPVVIGAPVNDGCRAKLGDDKFNHTPCYENLLDQTKDANNVVIRNCHIYQSPTYIEHRKADRTEPFFTSEYENARRGAQPVTNYGAIVNVWTAIAIKGTNITVENNVIEGGGDCLCIMGAQNCLIRNNIMVGGDMAGCMSFFSTSYNPDNSWRRQCRNIILEGNEFSIQSKTSRAIFLDNGGARQLLHGSQCDKAAVLALRLRRASASIFGAITCLRRQRALTGAGSPLTWTAFTSSTATHGDL